MKVIQKENYKIIEANNDDLAGFATLISRNREEIENDNVVIDILEKKVTEKDLLVFLEISNLHRMQKKSFVIAAKGVSIDGIPEELMVVPTLQEAEDIINMEELERELE